MTRQHSVRSHLNTASEDYDRVIRTFIPGYDEMLSTIGWWLAQIVPANGTIVELGSGTGALAQTLLKALPMVRMELWDIDREMLGVARDRLRDFADRVTFRERSFTEEMTPCDAVVGTLSLHHLPGLEEKQALYTRVYNALSTPGVFLIGDCTIDNIDPAHSTMRRYWTSFMAAHGISEAEARHHFSEWDKEDTYQPTWLELRALAQAGFPHPDVFWKQGPIAVFGGLKVRVSGEAR